MASRGRLTHRWRVTVGLHSGEPQYGDPDPSSPGDDRRGAVPPQSSSRPIWWFRWASQRGAANRVSVRPRVPATHIVWHSVHTTPRRPTKIPRHGRPAIPTSIRSPPRRSPPQAGLWHAVPMEATGPGSGFDVSHNGGRRPHQRRSHCGSLRDADCMGSAFNGSAIQCASEATIRHQRHLRRGVPASCRRRTGRSAFCLNGCCDDQPCRPRARARVTGEASPSRR